MNTGSKYLDQFYSYKGLTIIYGKAATGKTTLATLSAIAHAREQKKVVFLDTEGSFSIERVKQLAPDYETFLGNMLYKNAQNYYKQIEYLKKTTTLSGVKLVIVDTIGSHFRNEVKKNPEKTQDLLRWQIETLRKISKKIPVIITNQVYQDMKTQQEKMTAEKILRVWADQVLHLQKEPRMIHFDKPTKEPIPFTITNEGISY